MKNVFGKNLSFLLYKQITQIFVIVLIWIDMKKYERSNKYLTLSG